jgi:predicted nucleic acid-binding protein
MPYCVDTSAWLDGWRRRYSPDVFPTLWQRIESQITAGSVFSSEEVYVELAKKDDDLHKWIQKHKHMLVPPEEEIQREVAKILTKYPRLVDTLKNRSQADPFVIATAIQFKATVVTGESPGTEDRPRIPFVCQREGIKCIDFLQMLREMKLSF